MLDDQQKSLDVNEESKDSESKDFPADIEKDESLSHVGVPKTKGPIAVYDKLKNRYQNWKDRVIGIANEDTEEDAIYGSDWNQLGYQRTIAGFFYTFGLLIPQIIVGILFIPLIQYTELRFVEVGGISAVATGLFGAVYTILDLDLQESINRFVPQYAISDPRTAMQYVSFFVKYQMWSGLFQITFVSSFILFYLIPTNSDFAYVSWYMIFICVKQYPATLGTFHGLLNSLQQRNKAELITFYRASIVEPLTKLVGGLIGLYYGTKNPVWGPMMGLALGTAIGSYVDDFFTFALGTYWLSKVLDDYGIKIREIYGQKVPSEVWKSALWFSARLMPKTIFGAILGWTGFIIRVDNTPGYTTYESLTKRAKDLSQYISWSDDIINKSKAAFSEAYNNGKVELTKFYIANGLKYFTMLFVILGTVNFMAFPVIIDIAIPLFMPEEWLPITKMVPIYILLFVYKPFNDIADKMVFLSGHPEVNTVIGIIGTIGDLFFTYYFIAVLEMGWLGLILYPVPMQLLGFAIRWVYMSRKVLKLDKDFWKDIAWQVFVAPLVSGLVFVGIMAVVLYILYPLIRDPLKSMSIFGLEGAGILIAGILIILVMFAVVVFLYLPLYSYFGGWDERTMKIFKKSIPLTGPSLWLMWPMYKALAKFYGSSPFKKQAYMHIGDAAQKELRDLAITRKKNMENYRNQQN